MCSFADGGGRGRWVIESSSWIEDRLKSARAYDGDSGVSRVYTNMNCSCYG